MKIIYGGYNESYPVQACVESVLVTGCRWNLICVIRTMGGKKNLRLKEKVQILTDRWRFPCTIKGVMQI